LVRGPYFASPKGLSLWQDGSRQAENTSIQDASLVQQSGMDDLPLVAPPRPEIQQRRVPVLKLAEELERVSGSWRCWINGLGFQPAIPFQKKK
jgi:hypothetical protein